MRRFGLLVAGVLVVGLVAGCDSILGIGGDDGRDRRGATTVEVEGLAVHLFVPDTVAVADSFAVRVVVRNQTTEKRALTTPSACLTGTRILDARNERVPFRGSARLCAAVVTTREIPSYTAIERQYDMQAVLDTPDGDQPAAPGSYTVQVDLDWSIEGDDVELSVKEDFVVQR